MDDPIAQGDILFQQGTNLPGSLLLQTASDSNGWVSLPGDRSTFDRAVQKAGWTFFFMAGELKATVFGFDKAKALRGALKKLTAGVKFQNCNSIEITQVMSKSFLKFPYVRVSAHPRHIQKGMYFAA